MTHAWKYMGDPDANPMGLHFMSLIFGLGFVMSFGYWCTDYLVVGKFITLAGILISIATAYIAKGFNNINDFLQLVFGFVNGPLFATFLLGMFWKRTTGHGAFWGLVAGTVGAALTHGLTVAEGKGGWIDPFYEINSGMGQAFIVAGISWIINFFTTIIISLMTKPKPEEELKGLVYSLTDK